MEVYIGVSDAKGRRSIKALTMLPVIGKDLQLQLLDKRPMSKIIISTSVHLSHHVQRGTRVTFIHVGYLRPVSIIECCHSLITHCTHPIKGQIQLSASGYDRTQVSVKETYLWAKMYQKQIKMMQQ